MAQINPGILQNQGRIVIRFKLEVLAVGELSYFASSFYGFFGDINTTGSSDSDPREGSNQNTKAGVFHHLLMVASQDVAVLMGKDCRDFLIAGRMSE